MGTKTRVVSVDVCEVGGAAGGVATWLVSPGSPCRWCIMLPRPPPPPRPPRPDTVVDGASVLTDWKIFFNLTNLVPSLWLSPGGCRTCCRGRWSPGRSSPGSPSCEQSSASPAAETRSPPQSPWSAVENIYYSSKNIFH